MSTSTSTSLTARKPEEAKQLIDYAIELTKAWSLKKLGYDITIRDEERDQYSGFGIDKEDGVYWHDFIGGGTKREDMIPVDTFIKQITERFPHLEMKRRDALEGGGCGEFEAVFRNGKWSEVNDYTLDVYVENDAEFCLLAEKMNDKEFYSSYRIYDYKTVMNEQFVTLSFREVTEEETKQILDGIIGKMTTVLPQTELFCILVHDESAGSGIEKKAIAKDGAAAFQEITLDEIEFLETSSDFLYGDNEPKAEYIKLLFKTDPEVMQKHLAKLREEKDNRKQERKQELMKEYYGKSDRDGESEIIDDLPG